MTSSQIAFGCQWRELTKLPKDYSHQCLFPLGTDRLAFLPDSRRGVDVWEDGQCQSSWRHYNIPSGSSAVSIGSHIYLMGGGRDRRSCSVMDLSDPESPRLRKLSPMTEPRTGFSLVPYEDRYIVVLGGEEFCKGSKYALTLVEMYDTLKNQWIPLPEMSEEMAGTDLRIAASGKWIAVLEPGFNSRERIYGQVLDMEAKKWENFFTAPVASNMVVASAGLASSSDSLALAVATRPRNKGGPVTIAVHDLKTRGSFSLPPCQNPDTGNFHLALWGDKLLVSGGEVLEAIPICVKRLHNLTFVKRLHHLSRAKNLTSELMMIGTNLGGLVQLPIYYTIVTVLSSMGVLSGYERHMLIVKGLERTVSLCVSLEHYSLYVTALCKAHEDGVITSQEKERLHQDARKVEFDGGNLAEEFKALVTCHWVHVDHMEHYSKAFRRTMTKLQKDCEAMATKLSPAEEKKDDGKKKDRHEEQADALAHRRQLVGVALDFCLSILDALALEVGSEDRAVVPFHRMVDFSCRRHMCQVLEKLHCGMDEVNAAAYDNNGGSPPAIEGGDTWSEDDIKEAVESEQVVRLVLALAGKIQNAFVDHGKDDDEIATAETEELSVSDHCEARGSGGAGAGSGGPRSVSHHQQHRAVMSGNMEECTGPQFAPILLKEDQVLGLFVAIKYGYMEVLEEVFVDNPNINVNCCDSMGRTPTDFCAIMGETAMMKYLIAKGGQCKLADRIIMRILCRKRAEAKAEGTFLVFEPSVISSD